MEVGKYQKNEPNNTHIPIMYMIRMLVLLEKDNYFLPYSLEIDSFLFPLEISNRTNWCINREMGGIWTSEQPIEWHSQNLSISNELNPHDQIFA